MKPIPCALPSIGLPTGCCVVEKEPDLRIGLRYRKYDDACRRVGETRFSQPVPDRSRDLVGCPGDFSGCPAFIIKTDATRIARTESHVFHSVPL